MSVPATRQLETVLKAALTDGGAPCRLVVATGGAALTGTDANAYANVVIGGTTVKAPRLKGSTVAAPGAVAYLLQTDDFLLYLGTCSTS